MPQITIERARETDREAILDVMRPWNMHHVPSVEMESMDLANYFVARDGARIIGAAGYCLLSQTVGKTTLLGVLPEYTGSGVGKALQRRRLETMHRLGVKTVITNTDRPATIKWLTESYGFRPVGTLKKLMSFGDPAIDHWTTLELDLTAWMSREEGEAARRALVARNLPHPLAPYPPLLIGVDLQESPRQAVTDAARTAAEAGAAIVVVNGLKSAAEVAEVLCAIRRQSPDLVLGIDGLAEPLSDILKLDGEARPEVACLTLGSYDGPDGPHIHPADQIARRAAALRDAGVRPLLEVLDLGMIGKAGQLECDGLLRPPHWFNLRLGYPGGAPATLVTLAAMTTALPHNSSWAAGGADIFTMPVGMMAIAAGGGVWVGSLNRDREGKNAARPDDFRKDDLAGLIGRLVRFGAELGRAPASPGQAREMLGLA